MSPHHQQLDSTALAWLQLLQSQVPAQHDPNAGSSGGAQANVQGHPERPSTQPTHLPDNPADPEEDDSEAERASMAEDKRRRNTAASGDHSIPSSQRL